MGAMGMRSAENEVKTVANSTAVVGEILNSETSFRSFTVKSVKLLKFCVDFVSGPTDVVMDKIHEALSQKIKEKLPDKVDKAFEVSEIKEHSCCQEGYTCHSS